MEQRRTLTWLTTVGAGFAVAGILMVLVGAAAIWLRFGVDLRGREPAIAVVRIEGVITNSTPGLFSSAGTRADTIVRRLERLSEDDRVRAVVLRINSPGGGVVASDEIRAGVMKVRAKGKPVVTSMSELAASGGYYVAVASDLIFANPQTTTGSIGVLAVVPIIEGLLERIGVEFEVIRSGPLKGKPSGFSEMDEQERAILQALIDEAHDRFVAVVAEGRRLDSRRVRELADGRVYSGEQARRLGLVDEIGGLSEAIARAGEMAGLGPKPRVIEARPRTLFDELSGLRGIAAPPSAAVAATGIPIDPSAPIQYLYLGTGR